MSGISTNRTNIALPGAVSSEIIQKTQEASAVMNLARQIQLPGTGVTIPMITGDPEANWVAETAAKPVSNPTLDKKVMTPYKLAVIVPFSDEFARDYARLYDALVDRIPGALAKKFDATVFNGSAPGTGFDVLTNCTAQSIDVNASGVGGFYKALVASDMDIALPLTMMPVRSSSMLYLKVRSRVCLASRSSTPRDCTSQATLLPDLPLQSRMCSDSPVTGPRRCMARLRA